MGVTRQMARSDGLELTGDVLDVNSPRAAAAWPARRADMRLVLNVFIADTEKFCTPRSLVLNLHSPPKITMALPQQRAVYNGVDTLSTKFFIFFKRRQKMERKLSYTPSMCAQINPMRLHPTPSCVGARACALPRLHRLTASPAPRRLPRTCPAPPRASYR